MIVLFSTVALAQNNHFDHGYPTDISSVSFQIDPFGSADKEGLNSVISVTHVDFEWLEWEVSSQTIITSKYSLDNKMLLDYIDLQFGPGVLMPINTRMSITAGVHGGFLYRGKNDGLIDDNGDLAHVRSDDSGGFMYGGTLKFRMWLGMNKRWSFVMSSAYDRRSELGKFVLNNRLGMELRF